MSNMRNVAFNSLHKGVVMRNFWHQLLLSTLFIAQISLAALAADPAAKDQPGFVPWPKTLTLGQGSLALSENSRILAERQDLLPLAKILSEEIQLATGRQLATGVGKAAARGRGA